METVKEAKAGLMTMGEKAAIDLVPYKTMMAADCADVRRLMAETEEVTFVSSHIITLTRMQLYNCNANRSDCSSASQILTLTLTLTLIIWAQH